MSTAVLKGSVHNAGGGGVPGAKVIVSGAGGTQTATTDENGDFTVSVPPGIYHIGITKGGFNSVSLNDFTAVAGTTTPVPVTMSQADLNSLQTIGTVTSTTRGSTINTGPAASSFLSAEAIGNFAAPTINDVLQHVAGVQVQQMGSQQDRSIVVGGVQPYETQVLIDGHPLALGQYGVWVSSYFPSFLVGGIETQIGPGNTTPFANLAVGGTANILTPSFTSKPGVEVTQGYDNYGSQYTSLLTSGTYGKVGFVGDVGYTGLNSPFTGSSKCIVSPDGNNPGYGTISTCTNSDGQLFQTGEVLKLKYDFSSNTSFEAGFVGAWGGWNPQGTAWGTYLGPLQVEACQVATVKTPNPICGDPTATSNLLGKTITGYAWYTGSSLFNNQELWDAQFRTSFDNTTLVVRPYVGVINPEVINGAGQTSYASFYGPVGSGQFPNGTPVTVTGGYGTPIYYQQGNNAPVLGNAYAQTCNAGYGVNVNTSGLYTTKGNDQFECFSGPYTTYEQDKLYGMTTSLVQQLGADSTLNLTYDFHGTSTFAYINNPTPPVAVPFSTTRYSTFSLVGNIALMPKLTMNLGLYDTLWSVNGLQLANQLDPNSGLVPLNRTVSRGDPHIAFVARPNPNVVVRASYGNSTTFPFVGQLSGNATYETPACSLGPPFADGGTLTEKNPSLAPETSIGYDLGADVRLKGPQTVGVDLQQTIVHGVFEQITQAVPVNLPTLCGTPTALEGIFFPANVAKLAVNSVILKYSYAPRKGFGFNLQATGESSILSGLTPSLFAPGSYSVPANNVQICGNGVAAPGIATCIPYLSGYGQFTWAQPNGDFLGLGVNYQGKNNAYFQPPFALVDLVYKRNVTKNAELQLSVQNLLNTNNYGAYLPIPGAGTPLVADTTDVNFSSISQGTFTPTEVPASPRYVRLQLRLHVGR